jgi:hypothetical protein
VTVRHRFEYLVLPSLPAAECPSCRTSDLKQMISLRAMSSETTREASLGAAHQKAAREIVKIRKIQTGYQVDGGLAVKDQDKSQK